jgi:hypothetical protein
LLREISSNGCLQEQQEQEQEQQEEEGGLQELEVEVGEEGLVVEAQRRWGEIQPTVVAVVVAVGCPHSTTLQQG